MAIYTVGNAGADYPDLRTAWNDKCNGKTLSENTRFKIIDSHSLPGAITGTCTLNSYELEIYNGSGGLPNGEPGVGYIVSNTVIDMWFAVGSGTVNIHDAYFAHATDKVLRLLPLGAPTGLTRYFYVDHCVFENVQFDHVCSLKCRSFVSNLKIFKSRLDLSGMEETASNKENYGSVENVDVYGNSAGNHYSVRVRGAWRNVKNIVSCGNTEPAFDVIDGPNVVFENCADDDGTLSLFSTVDCVSHITPSDEFKSVDPTSSDFLKVKETAPNLRDGGTAPVYTSTDIAGLPIPDSYGDYPIGCHTFQWPAVTADFSASPTSGNADLTVSFTDLSTGSPTSWLWDFGDGHTSTDQNPTHTYTDAGNHTVTLTASNPGNSDTETKTDYITVNMAADFNASPTSGDADLTVSFTDTSLGNPTSWLWDFGDGNTSTDQHPVHTYTQAGIYTVALTATRGASSDTEIKTDYITVNMAADFSASPTSGDADLTVSFSDTSLGNPTSWLWDFGDGDTSTDQHPTHTYTDAGNHTVTLTASNPYSSDTEIKTDYITVNMAADFSASPTSGDADLTVSFSDTSLGNPTSWLWDFGDGDTSTDQHPTHTYTDAGNHTVTLTASNPYSSDTETKTDYITVNMVTDFQVSDTSGEADLVVNFTDITIGSPTNWLWDFGDGQTSTAQNPSYTYTNAGIYTIQLTASNTDATDTETKTDYIMVDINPDFIGNPTLGDADLTVSFTDLSKGNPDKWLWDFGDGSSSSVQDPTHVYTTAKKYTVKLTAYKDLS